MSALIGSLQIRHILVALLALPALYLTFILYQSGNVWIALVLLVVTRHSVTQDKRQPHADHNPPERPS